MKKIFLKNQYFFIFFMTSFIIYAIWLIAFFPGIMSYDSISQWGQSSIRVYNDAHPFLHSFIITLLRLIWNSPAIIALFQIIISSFIIAYSLNFFIKIGVSKTKIILIFITFLILPSIGIYNVTLWKDVLFSQCITLLSIIFIKNYINKEKISQLNIVLIAFLTILISNIRHNGVIYLIIVPIVYFLFKIVNIKKLLMLILYIILFYIFFNLIIFNALNVTNKSNFLPMELIRLQIIGNALRMGYNPTIDETNIIEKVMPIDEFKKRYECSAVDYLRIDDSPINEEVFYDKIFLSNFNKTVDNIIIHNSQYAVADRMCLFSTLIGIGNTKLQYLYHTGIDENTLNLKQYPNKQLSTFLNKYLTWSTKYPQRFIFWSYFLYIIIYIYFTIKAIHKKNYALLGFIILVTINIPALFIFSIARDYRYLYMIQFALPFIFLIDDIKYN